MIVEHPIFGPGRALTSPLAPGPGPRVVVRFADGLHPVARAELNLLDGAKWPGLAQVRCREKLSGRQRRASVWLEALRFGTVAEAASDTLTVGREHELKLVDGDLQATSAKGGACRVFCGPYGAGKSHLLEIVRRRAAAQGLATVSAVLDRKKITPSRPRRLMRELLLNLQIPGRTGSGTDQLNSLLDLAQRKGSEMLSRSQLGSHHYLTPLLSAWRVSQGDLRHELIHWISGGERTQNRRLRARVRAKCGHDPGPFYAFKDHRTVWNQLTYMLTGWSFLLRETELARGLVVILDEAEMCAVANRAEQAQGDKCLTGLCAAALGRRGVQRPRLLSLKGGHAATRDFPAFYQGRAHLYLALGMATDSQGRECLARILPTSHFCSLAPLSSADVEFLLGQILNTYRTAFPHFPLGPGFGGPLGQLLLSRGQPMKTPRQIVQQALGFLDGARSWRGSVEQYVEAFLRIYEGQ